MPARTVEEAGKALALLSWLGFFVAYGVAALVIRIVEQDGNRFARWHASEALNLQLTLLVIWVPTFLPLWFAMILVDQSDAPPWPFLAVFALGSALAIGALVVIVLGSVRAAKGVWWRCPVVIPFLRSHRRERSAELARA
jgi:uncharacterized Tic20 family protein